MGSDRGKPDRETEAPTGELRAAEAATGELTPSATVSDEAPTGVLAPGEAANGAVSPHERPTGEAVPATGAEDEAPTGAVIPDEAPTGAVIPDEAPTGAVIPDEAPTGAVIPDEAPTGAVIPDEAPTGVIAAQPHVADAAALAAAPVKARPLLAPATPNQAPARSINAPTPQPTATFDEVPHGHSAIDASALDLGDSTFPGGRTSPPPRKWSPRSPLPPTMPAPTAALHSPPRSPDTEEPTGEISPAAPPEDEEPTGEVEVTDPRARAARSDAPRTGPGIDRETAEDRLLTDPPPAATKTPAAPITMPLGDKDGWRSLHPASLVVNLIPQAWKTARGSWPLLLALFIGGEGMGMELVDLTILFAFFAATLSRTVVHFLTCRYRLHRGKFEVRSGLLNRRARVLDPARIQNVELIQNLFHKAAGLVELKVETAGDAGTDGLLSALSARDAHDLQRELRRLARSQRSDASDTTPSTSTTDHVPQPTSQPLLEMGVLETIAYGFSRRSVGAVALIVAVGLEVLARTGQAGAEDVAWAARPGSLAGIILLALAASWALSAGRALFRHHNFLLHREGDQLITQEGLTTRRRVEIPFSKVQLVRVDEPLLRRLMGYGTVLIETAALGFADGEVRQAEGVLPMVESDRLPEIARVASPSVQVNPWKATLKPAHPRALYRAIVARLLRTTMLAAVLAWVMAPWGWVAFLMLPIAVPVAWMDWKKQGWLVTNDAIIARRGWLTRRTWLIARQKVQSAHVLQSPTMRIHGLGRLVIRVAGSEVHLPDVALREAREQLEALRPTLK